MASLESPFTIRNEQCSRRNLFEQIKSVVSSNVILSLPFIIQGDRGPEMQKFVREVAAEAGLRTTYVACGEKDTPSRIMSLLVAGLKGVSVRPARCALHTFRREMLEHCPPHETRWCIIVDNIEHISMHEDMGELVRTGERTGYGINAVFVLLCNFRWSRDMVHKSAPDMAVYGFEHLSLIEVKQILIDDPELAGLDDQARRSWDTTVRIFLPKCAMWRRDFDGLKENLQTVHHLYISLGNQHPYFTEAQRRDELLRLFWERLKGCMPELRPNRFSIESAKQPTLEEVVQRGMDCILLLLALHVAAWNSIGADRVVMYHASTGRTKKDPKGAAAYKKVKVISGPCN
ncbi:hypothetical protein ABBQ38_013231 [Trebouxia sp. C0009 RCD-2024]